MLKKRLIFTLLWRNGAYCLSRNFKLQNAGDLKWLQKHYNLQRIAFSIDELIVVNVAREDKQMKLYAANVGEVSRGCFAPLAVGGGIRSMDDAKLLLNSGADKLVLNTPIFTQPELVASLVQAYGSQCVAASIDYKRVGGRMEVFTRNGTEAAGMDPVEAVLHAQRLGAGEIFLTSMDKDGTGQGYDMETLDRVVGVARVPVIASGGVGNYEHLAAWLVRDRAQAATTANIFNFLGEGLTEARKHLTASGLDLATWDFGWRGRGTA